MSIVPQSVSDDAKAEMQRLAAERYAPTTHRRSPVEFSQEVADAICRRLTDGESLRAICRDEDMPAKWSVLRWAADPEKAEFCAQYARAMMLSGDADHDDVGDMARQIARGELDYAAGRAAMDGLKWTAGRKNPKKYGDRTVIAGDKDAPLAVADVTDLERAKAVAALVAAAQRGGG